MDSAVVTIETGNARGTYDITGLIDDFLAGRGDGLVSVFVPHATAGIVIIETGAGSDQDFMDMLDRTVVRDDELYRHRHGTAGHGADHVIPGIVSPSITVPVIAGRMALGTWQSVVLVDPNADNRSRQVRVSFLDG